MCDGMLAVQLTAMAQNGSEPRRANTRGASETRQSEPWVREERRCRRCGGGGLAMSGGFEVLTEGREPRRVGWSTVQNRTVQVLCIQCTVYVSCTDKTSQYKAITRLNKSRIARHRIGGGGGVSRFTATGGAAVAQRPRRCRCRAEWW
jgi:hypothetical protein